MDAIVRAHTRRETRLRDQHGACFELLTGIAAEHGLVAALEADTVTAAI